MEEPMKDLFSLKGKVALVTGGNAGLGKGIARGFAQAGADIAIGARNKTKTDEVVRELKEEFGVRAIGVQVDVRQEQQILDMVQKILDHFGRIDILVNNAGMNIRKFPQDITSKEWDEVLEVNLRSAFLCAKAVYPAMKKAGGGKIISIGSTALLLGGAKLDQCGARKGGLLKMPPHIAVAV